MRQLGVNAAGTTRATRVAVAVGVDIGVGVVGTVAVAVAALVSASHKAFSLLPITLKLQLCGYHAFIADAHPPLLFTPYTYSFFLPTFDYPWGSLEG
jgi:hypothetical protein